MFKTVFSGVSAAVVLCLGLALSFLQVSGTMPISPTVVFLVRWVALGILVGFGIRRRLLTAWILISMFVGAEVGYDWPSIGMHGRLFRMIFLRLIKTIIAPPDFFDPCGWYCRS